MAATLEVEKRIVNVKRHTVGYVINGSSVSRKEAVKLARRGWLTNATDSNNGEHLVGVNARLYDLPTRIK